MKQATIKRVQKKHVHISVSALILLTLFVGSIIYLNVRPADRPGPKRLVTIYDRGKKQIVLTHATNVKDALAAARIRLNSKDDVEPGLTAQITSTNEDIIIYRSRLVAVVDGNIRQNTLTVAQSPNAILHSAKLDSLGPDDKASFVTGSIAAEGTRTVLKVERVKKEEVAVEPEKKQIVFAPLPNALSASKGAQIFVDSQGVAHRETYYDLPMNRVVASCGGSYTIRSDGAKVDQDGYVLVAANLNSYPRCSVVETSLGPGKVYDTGGFAAVHPYGFDLATDWTNYNGQ